MLWPIEVDIPMPGAKQIRRLIEQLEALHAEMLKLKAPKASRGLQPQHRHGFQNLLHYVALRRHDIRELQRQLASLGLSSLGRTESHVLGSIGAVIHLLRHMNPAKLGRFAEETALGNAEGRKRLERNTDALLGSPPDERTVRIMVTMPSEAATDYDLVRNLV